MINPLTIFAACVLLIAVVVAIIFFCMTRKDDYYSIALLSIHVAISAAVSTFGKSLIFDFAVNLGTFNFKGSYGDAVHNIWETVLIVLIMAFTAITMMYFRYKIELRKTPSA